MNAAAIPSRAGWLRGTYSERIKSVHCTLSCLDLILIIFLLATFRDALGWISFPLVLNRSCELGSLSCLHGHRPILFSVMQPIITAIGVVSKETVATQYTVLVPLLCFHVVILVIVAGKCQSGSLASEPQGILTYAPPQEADESVTLAPLVPMYSGTYVLVILPDMSHTYAIQFDQADSIMCEAPL